MEGTFLGQKKKRDQLVTNYLTNGGDSKGMAPRIWP